MKKKLLMEEISKANVFKQLAFKEMQNNIDLNFYDITMKGKINNP